MKTKFEVTVTVTVEHEKNMPASVAKRLAIEAMSCQGINGCSVDYGTYSAKKTTKPKARKA